MSTETATGIQSTGPTRAVSLREYASLERENQRLKREQEELQEEYKDYREANELDKADIKKRLSKVEEEGGGSGGNGEGEPVENSLPIQQVTNIWKVGGTINAQKDEHAAALWSDFLDRSERRLDAHYLDSGEVRQILREHFRNDERHMAIGENVARSTIHRAMDALCELSGELITSDVKKNGRRTLIMNADEFREFTKAIGAVTDDVTPENESDVTRGG